MQTYYIYTDKLGWREVEGFKNFLQEHQYVYASNFSHAIVKCAEEDLTIIKLHYPKVFISQHIE